MESVTEHGHQWTLSRKGLPSTQQHHTKFNENNATLPDVGVVSQSAGQKPLAAMREEFTKVAKKTQSTLGFYPDAGSLGPIELAIAEKTVDMAFREAYLT
jgi:hypothetical protein